MKGEEHATYIRTGQEPGHDVGGHLTSLGHEPHNYTIFYVMVPDVAAARRRGVIFDFGNGVRDHFDWATVERATKQGFWPDTISTDWNVMSKTTGVIDFPNVMSKFIMFDMPLSQIIACATVNAARVFPSFDDRGTLNVGAPADVAILELREGSFEFLDNYKGTRTGRQRLFPAGTVLAGKQVERA